MNQYTVIVRLNHEKGFKLKFEKHEAMNSVEAYQKAELANMKKNFEIISIKFIKEIKK